MSTQKTADKTAEKTTEADVEVPAVVLDLDTLEREDAAETFTFRHLTRVYTLLDPQEIDWQELIISIGNSFHFFQTVLPAEDQTEFFAAKMPSWKMKALMERYQVHYGLPDPKALAA